MRHALLVILVACGGGSNTPPDAPPDAVLDAPEPPPGVTRFIIDKENIPTTNTQARTFALDLDGDGMVDNQLGMVLSTLAGQGFDVQGATDVAVSHGDILQLVELTATTFATFVGANPMPRPCAAADTVCRHHLMGTGSFDIASGRDTPLVGVLAGTVFTAGPGHITLQLSLLGAAPVPVTLIGAKVKLTNASATAIPDAILAGGITPAERDAKIYPSIRDSANAAITRDCTKVPPDCGCTAGTTGKTMANLFDTVKDCNVTIDEIKNNSLLQSLFAPDVTLEAQQALSVGISVTAVHAGFPN